MSSRENAKLGLAIPGVKVNISLIIEIFFLKKEKFGGHVLFGATDTLFWTSSDVSPGFQSQSGQPYSHLAEAYVYHHS